MRVLLVFHHLGPYHRSRLTAASRRMELICVELSGESAEYAWAKVEGESTFERVTLFPNGDCRRSPTRELAHRLHSFLEKRRPQVVVLPGWSERASYSGLTWCGSTGVPAVVMSDSSAWDKRRITFREAMKQWIVSRFSAALVAGTLHMDYVVRLGMPRDRVFLGYDAVDNEFFASKAREVRLQPSVVRSRYGLPASYFLASARFVEKKNLPRLLQAYARYRQLAEESAIGTRRSGIWNLVLLGDGPLRSTLSKQGSALNLGGRVQMPGFMQYPDLPAYYGLASAFVHASTTEQWGLVVNEAMASSLPVVVSNRSGCGPDLVHEGVNGYKFDPFNVEDMALAMLKVWKQDEDELRRMGLESTRIIADWGTERFAQGLTDAVETALKVGPKRMSLRALWLLKTLMYR